MANNEEKRVQDYWLSKIQLSSKAFEVMPESLKTEAICLAAVKTNGLMLKHVPEQFKTAEVCLEAVWNCYYALEYVPETLKTEKMCLAAVLEAGHALQYVPESLKTKAVCLAAVKTNGQMLKYVPESLKTKAMCLAALNETAKAHRYVPENLRAQLMPKYTTKLTYDEIKIINVWAKGIRDPHKTLVIDETIFKKGKYRLIDSYSQSKLKNIKCVADAYWCIISIEFSMNNTKARLDYAYVLGPLSGDGWAATFSKKIFFWKQIENQHTWIS